MDRPALLSVSGKTLALSSQALATIVRASLDRGAPVRFRARGTSMHPIIKDGDLVTIAPKGRRVPVPGDVVGCTHPSSGKLLVHRIISKGPEGCLIQGDNAGQPEGIIPSEAILGVVHRVERRGRQVSFGLGPERFLIAFLVRRNALRPVIRQAKHLSHFVSERLSA